MSSDWKTVSGYIGHQQIDENSSTQNHELGTCITAKHDTYGVGEFIYLKGVGSTTVGAAVTYTVPTFQTALAAVGTNKPEPVAFAMAATVANEYGWYQIGGIAVAKKTATVSLAADVAVGVLTAGLIAATGSGKEVVGALVAVVASAKSDVTTVQLTINRPHMQGRIT